MRSIEIDRIKKAGENLTTLAILIIVVNLVALVVCMHFFLRWNIEDLKVFLPFYIFIQFVFFVFMLYQLFSAGFHLRNCDVAIVVKETTTTVFRKTTDGVVLKIVSIGNESIGAAVFIEEEPAPSGLYNYEKAGEIITISVEKGKLVTLH